MPVSHLYLSYRSLQILRGNMSMCLHNEYQGKESSLICFFFISSLKGKLITTDPFLWLSFPVLYLTNEANENHLRFVSIDNKFFLFFTHFLFTFFFFRSRQKKTSNNFSFCYCFWWHLLHICGRFSKKKKGKGQILWNVKGFLFSFFTFCFLAFLFLSMMPMFSLLFQW